MDTHYCISLSPFLFALSGVIVSAGARVITCTFLTSLGLCKELIQTEQILLVLFKLNRSVSPVSPVSALELPIRDKPERERGKTLFLNRRHR